MPGVGAVFLPAPSIPVENITYGSDLPPMEVTMVASHIKDGVARTKDTGLMLAPKVNESMRCLKQPCIRGKTMGLTVMGYMGKVFVSQ